MNTPRRIKISLTSVLLTCWVSLAWAIPHELYPFHDHARRQQFYQLTQQIRCLVCANETVADSNAPIAVDLRNKVYQLVKQGQSTEAIQQYLVSRYGEVILLKPRVTHKTIFLWFAPFLFLLAGFYALYKCRQLPAIEKEAV